MKYLFFIVSLLGLTIATQTAKAQASITPLIYPQYSTDSSTGGRLPYVFRAKITGLNANTLYRFYARGASLAVDGLNAGSGAAIFIKQNGNFTYSTTPSFFVATGYDTMRTNSLGEVTNWFAFEPTRGNTTRFSEGNYIHGRVFLQSTGGGPGGGVVVTVLDSIQNIKIDISNNNATGVYSTSMAAAKDLVFLYDNSTGTGRPLSGTWIERDGLNFKSGNGIGGTPNATAYPAYYRNEVDTIAAAWGSFIPNQLSSGLLRIERRKLSDGTIGWSNTDADGIWDIGSVNTVNASNGLSALNIATDDAPLINVPPKIYFVNAKQSIAENAGTVSIGVGLKFPSANPTSVDIVIAGGTASSVTDYTYAVQTVTFPANSTAVQYVSLSLTNDAVVEALENVIFGLTNYTNAATGGAVNVDTLTIIDDDVPYVSFVSAANSGYENITSQTIPVGIQFPNTSATSVNIAVSGGTATLGSDYTFSNQTITFPAGSSASINIPLTIIDDAVTEADETIIFTLSSVTNGAVLGTSTYTYTIKNDDITPILSFLKPNFQQVKENVGTVTVKVQLTNPTITATSINVSAFGGNAISGSDYLLTSNTLTFPANIASTISYTFSVTDDNLVEGTENIILRLTNPTNTVTYINEYDSIDILDNDVPNYTISQINKTDGLGYADSTAVRCELHGVVYGPNIRPAGYQVFIHDRTGGIQVFRTMGLFAGYNPQDKDSIVVKGDIQQVNGQLQITNLDTVFKVGVGTYITPKVISTYSGANEGEYVKLQYCHLLNTTQWPTGAANAIVTVVDQNNVSYQTQIFRQTDIDSTTPTPYWFHVSGILYQNDLTFPWDSNYYLVPLSLQNYEYVYPRLSFVTLSDTALESVGLDSIELNLQWAARTATSATVAFTGGSATFGQDFNFTSVVASYPAGFALNAKQKIGVLIIDDVIPEIDETINLSILGPSNNAIVTAPAIHTLVIKYNDGVGNGINTKTGVQYLRVYPNPFNSVVNVEAESMVQSLKLFDLQGRQVAESHASSLSLCMIPKGIYILTIETKDGIQSVKIAVE